MSSGASGQEIMKALDQSVEFGITAQHTSRITVFASMLFQSLQRTTWCRSLMIYFLPIEDLIWIPRDVLFPIIAMLICIISAMFISRLLSTTIFNIFDPAWLFTAVPYSFGHVFMFGKHFILVRMEVDLESIPETLGMKRECNLDGMPVHPNVPCTHSFTPSGILLQPIQYKGNKELGGNPQQEHVILWMQ